MITAVDTSVLVDIFIDDKQFGEKSASLMLKCLHEGSVVACGVVFAEIMPLFPSVNECLLALEALNVESVELSMPSFISGAEAWKQFKRSGGARERMVADFLIGGHAISECDRLLTRDRGFYRKYFKKLTVIYSE